MITLSLTVELESTDLTDLLDNANWNRLLSMLAAPPPATPSAPPRTLQATPRRQFVRKQRETTEQPDMDGRIPGHRLWESERDPRLPTLGGVLQRYKCATLAELAALVGLEPPLRGNHAPLGVQESQESQ